MALFDDAQRAQIEAAIAEVEAQTSGEIVVGSVRASDRYDDVRLLYASALTLSFSAIVHLVWPSLPVTWLLWLQPAVLVLAWLVLGLPPALRALVPAARLEESTQRRAREAFWAYELFATRDRSGVLIFLSEQEHRVVILADSGIHARMPDGAWNAHVRRIVEGFHAGDATTSVCAVVHEVGTVLTQAFPRRGDDANELLDAVRRAE